MFRPNYSHPSQGVIRKIFQRSGVLLYLILAIALVGFESFNFSTTQYALDDLLGKLTFAGIQWSTILAIAFCGIDFAGIGRLFLPETASDPSRETWYLFGAWLLAATMNAILTWWGVSMALVGHTIASTAILDRKLLLQAVPVFIAVMVWVTRVLLIGSFSKAGRHFQPAARREYANGAAVPFRPTQSSAPRMPAPSAPAINRPSSLPPLQRSPRPAPLPTTSPTPEPTRSTMPTHPEPEYIDDGDTPASGSPLPSLRPMTISAQPSSQGSQGKRS